MATDHAGTNVPGVGEVDKKMGDSQTIAGMILAGLATLAALATVVLMVLLHRAIASQTADTTD
jgi:hypothetical protein